jgi:hypothetical protein
VVSALLVNYARTISTGATRALDLRLSIGAGVSSTYASLLVSIHHDPKLRAAEYAKAVRGFFTIFGGSSEQQHSGRILTFSNGC